jgi:hypothetical protein
VANPLAVVLHASAEVSASGTSAAVDCSPEVDDDGPVRALLSRVLLTVTAHSGTTHTLLVTIETSPDGTTGWRSVGSFTLATDETYERLSFAPLERYVRASWTLGGTGTPKMTFSLSGTAHVIYALPEDLPQLALPAEAAEDLTASQKAAALLSATDTIASAIAANHTMPLLSWGGDVQRHTASIAAYDLMCAAGFRPEEYDTNLRQRYVDACGDGAQIIGWCGRVARGQIEPADLVDSTPDEVDGGAYVVTEESRGW